MKDDISKRKPKQMPPLGEPRKLSKRGMTSCCCYQVATAVEEKYISFFFSLRFMGQLCATNERVNMKSYLKYATNLSHFGLLAKNSKVLK